MPGLLNPELRLRTGASRHSSCHVGRNLPCEGSGALAAGSGKVGQLNGFIDIR